ncbi:MAG TPA: VWA domain-containing protein [Chthonomonadaceae bacterium]|nr:VWA domain-containing protein [Chthonomonadaceae bacterium]
MRRTSVWLGVAAAVALAVAGCHESPSARLRSGTIAPQRSIAKAESQAAVPADRDVLRAYERTQARADYSASRAESEAKARAEPTESLQADQAKRSQAVATAAGPPAANSMRPTPTGGGRARAQQFAQTMSPNMYISNDYMGGQGARDRLDKLIQEGVLVDGKRVKLEAFSRSYAQAFPIPPATALSVTAATERTRIVEEGDHTYLQVGIQAIKGELPRRPPLNVALVLDRSGSMADDHKLENAKAAARELIESLRPDDTFSLTAFDDQAQLLAPAQHVTDRAWIERMIAGLQPGGGTNIYAGLQSGYRQIAKFAGAESVNRVILLSDGQVTAGISDPQAFDRLTSGEADRDVQTTAVGLGLDFNEDLMMAIAREGRGNYHFIRDGADARPVFAKELDELTHVVAKAVRLRIRLAPGIGLVRVLGASTLDAEQTRRAKAIERRIDRRAQEELGIREDRQKDTDEPGIKLLIPSFYRGDSYIVMLELDVPRGAGRRRVAEVTLKYKDLVTRTNRSEQSAAAIDYTPSRDEAIASINRSVKKNLLGFQTGEALAAAGGLMSRGDVPGAVKRVDERMVVLGMAAREWGDRDLERDGLLLSRYEAILKEVARQRGLAESDLGHYVARSLTYNGYKMTR